MENGNVFLVVVYFAMNMTVKLTAFRRTKSNLNWNFTFRKITLETMNLLHFSRFFFCKVLIKMFHTLISCLIDEVHILTLQSQPCGTIRGAIHHILE